MATMTDLVPAVLDYLVAQCSASSLLTGVVVTDGPSAGGGTASEQQHLWIGWDEIAQAGTYAGEAATDEQVFAFLDSAQTRDQTGRIVCSAEYWSGTTTMKTSRDGCAAIVAAVEKLIRGYPGVGSSPGDATMGNLVRWSEVTALRWRQAQNESGAVVTCVFTVQFNVRLTS